MFNTQTIKRRQMMAWLSLVFITATSTPAIKLEAEIADPPTSNRLYHLYQDGTVSLQISEPTDVYNVIKTIAELTKRNIILTREALAAGKIQVVSQKPVTTEEAYRAVIAELNLLGLEAQDEGDVVKIVKKKPSNLH